MTQNNHSSLSYSRASQRLQKAQEALMKFDQDHSA